jgi:hypothetical protein
MQSNSGVHNEFAMRAIRHVNRGTWIKNWITINDYV